MNTTIKIFCIAASFTFFILSTSGIEIEETQEQSAQELACETIPETKP